MFNFINVFRMLPMSIMRELKAEVDTSIEKLRTSNFKVDPIAGKQFSRIPSVIGSMQKRHGLIIEKAIFEAVSSYDHFTVWKEETFKVSSAVNHAISNVNNVKQNPDWLHLVDHDYPYGEKSTTLQIDILAFNRNTKNLYALEIKRGYSMHDAGKKKSILRNALAVQMLLKGYGKSELGVGDFNSAISKICSYYKVQEFPSEIQIDKDDLDDFFEVPIYEMVEEVNNYFRNQIHSLMLNET